MRRKTSQLKVKIDLRPGAKLSARFDNRQTCYKVVETGNVLGYVVSSGSPVGTAAIYPLYNAFVHVKVGAVWHMVSSYEQGDRLNDYSFQADYQGCALAMIAAQAVTALEARRLTQRPLKQRGPKRQDRPR